MRGTSWIVFDGDCTLWDTQGLYDAATARFGELAARGGADPAAAMALSKEIDVERAAGMGYSMHRFPGSLREAARRVLGAGDHEWAASGIGYAVFAEAAPPFAGAGALLQALAAGGWRLALLTAGEVTVQEKRVSDFPWARLFEAVRIVPRKHRAVFSALAEELAADPASSWVVGDSLRSDVCPAVEAGFRAVLFESNNWHAFENAGRSLPAGAVAVSRLPDVLGLVGRPGLVDKATR